MAAFSDLRDVPASVVLDNHMSIQAAAQYSGYNLQYVRRLLCAGAIKGLKVGQVWLVKIASLDASLNRSARSAIAATAYVSTRQVAMISRTKPARSPCGWLLWFQVEGGDVT